MDKVELLGGACFSHGPYTFYKAVRIGNGRVLRLGNFFLTKLWTDADLISIGELQLLWLDSRGSNQPLASLRLYFLPENTPDGRRNTHGEDEVLTISEKVVVRVHDLITWLSPSLEWSWGREVAFPQSPKLSGDEDSSTTSSASGSGSVLRHDGNYPQVLTDPGIDFTDVDKQQKEFETSLSAVKKEERDQEDEDADSEVRVKVEKDTTTAPTPSSTGNDTTTATTTTRSTTIQTQTRVVVLSYPRYCRYRALLRRLEGADASWLCSSVAAALGGFTALPGTRVLFCRDTFDYPDLETHELLCNHLAPKLKGRPRRKRKKRSASPGESSNESEASVASTSRGPVSNLSIVPVLRPPSGVRRSERNTCGDEKKFLTNINSFMRTRGTPVGKMPLLGYRQIDLFLFYTKVQKLGGYDNVSAGRLWKSIYDDIGGNVSSTSAATITRRHYERLLLPYERHQRGEESKMRPSHARRMKHGSLSEDSAEINQEIGRITETPPPSSTDAPTTASPVPRIQSILSTSPFLTGDKPKTEGGKTSSLRSVRVKPERLKSLNTIIANSTTTLVNQNSQLPSPSPPPSSSSSSSFSSSSSSGSNTSTSNTPSSTPSTTPTNVSSIVGSGTVGNGGGATIVDGQSALERQLNSPLVSHQSPPAVSTSPENLPITTIVTTNASTTVVTLTPPPENDIKEIKLDVKPANLLAQGKENIPMYGEKSIFVDKSLVQPPKSPEVIDLEMENDTSRDKIIIPSFKKRKLEILREGGLEVTAVDLESRPSVIQATLIPVVTSSLGSNVDDKAPQTFTSIPNSVPKLISVTVTPDIGHMLPTSNEHQQPAQPQMVNGIGHPSVQTKQQKAAVNHQNHLPIQHTTTVNNNNNNNNSAVTNNNNNHSNDSSNISNNSGTNSRVINVGSPSNTSLLQLYANASNAVSAQPTSVKSPSLSPPMLNRSPINERLPAPPPAQPPPPPKVTQSRSIFAHSERTIYGNPKDILIPQKYHQVHQNHPTIGPQHNRPTPRPTSNNGSNNISAPAPPAPPVLAPNPSVILDLTHRQTDRSFARPNLEIVRVPVVPRPNPLNLEIKNAVKEKQQQSELGNRKAGPYPVYPGIMDSRTMASNNLEITLVNPKNRCHTVVASPHQPSQSPPAPRLHSNHNHGSNNSTSNNGGVSSNMSNNNNNIVNNTTIMSQPTQRRHQNGRSSRSEPVSPYSSRKPSHQPIIPNVPNLHHHHQHHQQQQQHHHLNNIATTTTTASPTTAGYTTSAPARTIMPQQIFVTDKRKSPNDAISQVNNQHHPHQQQQQHHRRISEGDKTISGQPQQQIQGQVKVSASQRQNDALRRHSVPANLVPTSGPTTQQNNPGFALGQLPPAAAAAAAAAAANPSNKFLPMLDPLYYSAFYSGLFPPPLPQQSPQTYMSPEFNAYYKELLASTQPRLAMTSQHQPAVPTSK